MYFPSGKNKVLILTDLVFVFASANIQFSYTAAHIRGGFKKFEEKCCQIVSFHWKFTICMHVVHKHIVNIRTKFE